MAHGLKIATDDEGENTFVRLDGRLDAASSVLLETSLKDLIHNQRKFLFLDFSKVDYLSSSGMRLLLSAAKQLKAKEGKLSLFSLQDDVMEVIKMAGFERILDIYQNQQEALDSL